MLSVKEFTYTKRYTSPDGKDHAYYDCSVGVIMNPLVVTGYEF